MVILVKKEKFLKSWKKKPENWPKLHKQGASPETPVSRYTAPPIDGSLPQKKRSVIHALARVDSNGDQPDVDQ